MLVQIFLFHPPAKSTRNIFDSTLNTVSIMVFVVHIHFIPKYSHSVFNSETFYFDRTSLLQWATLSLLKYSSVYWPIFVTGNKSEAVHGTKYFRICDHCMNATWLILKLNLTWYHSIWLFKIVNCFLLNDVLIYDQRCKGNDNHFFIFFPESFTYCVDFL